MSKNNPEQKWERPKLIVLVRGNRQEAVLDVCKTGGTGNVTYYVCLGNQCNSPCPCDPCWELVTS